MMHDVLRARTYAFTPRGAVKTVGDVSFSLRPGKWVDSPG